MGNTEKKDGFFYNIKSYILIGLAGVAMYSVFGLVDLLYDEFQEIMGVADYLTWHNVFELTSIIISFSVFIVSYYTYEQTGNLRSAFLGSVFLMVGIIDVFHTLSYKGMPAFLIENDTANRATTFWIISRYMSSIGFLVASFIHYKLKSSINKKIFTVFPFVISLLILIIVTYYPDLLPDMYIESTGLTSWKVYSEFIIIALFLLTVIRFVNEYNKTGEKLIFLFSISLLISALSEVSFVLYTSVYDLYNYLGHIYKFLAFFVVFRVILISNIQKPYLELFATKQELAGYVDNLDKLVLQRTLEIMMLNDKLLEDLSYAKDIQKAVFPSTIPEWKEISFEINYYSAERVSGDFYNIFRLDDKNIVFYIGDVSGHGVPAAMLTVFLNQTIKVLIDSEVKGTDILSPAEVLTSVYQSFNETNFKDEVYVVMLYAVYNIEERKLTYSSAGLNVQPLLVKHSGEISQLELKGFPICKFIEFYGGQYNNAVISLEPKDKILFFTDGLVEAQNKNKDFYEDKRLMEVVGGNFKKTSKELSLLISESVFEFINGNKPKDDITFFIMEVKK